MTDLTPYLPRLEALRPFLRGESMDDLDLVVTITKEGIRRTESPGARNHIAQILDLLFTVDPRLCAAPLAYLAKTARQAVQAVRAKNGGPRSGPECRAREAGDEAGLPPLDPSDPNAPAPQEPARRTTSMTTKFRLPGMPWHRVMELRQGVSCTFGLATAWFAK